MTDASAPPYYTSEGTYYVVQGLYGELGSDKRVWKDWYKDSVSLERAQRTRESFDRGINPKTTERSAPSASRIIKRTVVDEILEPVVS
jgi:hypothetical protein